MKKEIMNYETLLKITHAVVMCRDPEEVVLLIVESVKTALQAKGCTLFLFNRKTNALEVAASYGLSDEYLNKGPISSIRSIATSLTEGPVAIYDVTDDPRIQYPEEAKNEGILVLDIDSDVYHCWYDPTEPENVRKCKLGPYPQELPKPGRLGVPNRLRTTAGMECDADANMHSYVYWVAEGGVAWSIPYAPMPGIGAWKAPR